MNNDNNFGNENQNDFTQSQQPQQPAQSGFQPAQSGFQPAQNDFQPQTQTPVYSQSSNNESYNYNYSQPANNPLLEKLSSSALTMGILALVFAEFPFLSFLGIIFGALGLGKAKAFTASAGNLYGKAKVGRILSLVGLIISIVMTVIYFFYFFIIIIAIGSTFG